MATKYRAVTRAVLSNTWAILPEKLTAIVQLLNERAAGKKLSKSQIAARIGPQRRDAPAAGSVAVLNIFGTLAQHVGTMQQASGGVSTEAIGKAFDAALADPNVSAIVLNIDSPGGTVAGTPELAAKIYAARGQKPVVAIANALAASAAYWIGSAAEKFYATPSAQLGSIGVITVHTDDSKMLEKAGIKETVISAGKFKAGGWLPLTDEYRARIQGRVDANYAEFLAAVAKHRGVSVAQAKSDFGEGDVLNARDALSAGMIDRVASLEEVLTELGVGAASGNQDNRASAPAFSLKGLAMNPELFGALVRIGMCDITATQAQAENALDRFYAVKGKPKPADVAAQIADLKTHLEAKPQPSGDGNPAGGGGGGGGGGQAGPKDNAVDRATEILAVVNLANLGDGALAFAQELIADKSLSVSAAITKINAKAAELRKPSGATTSGGTVTATVAQRDKFTTEARDALLNRSFAGDLPKQIVVGGAGGQLVDYKPAGFNQSLQSLPRLAAQCLILDGFSPDFVAQLPDTHLAQLAIGVARPSDFGLRADSGPYNTTGTFSNLLMDAANVVLRRSYDEVPTTFQAWSRRDEDVTDFKTVNKVIAGEISDPKVVPEGGEFEEATMTDGKEKYSLRVWGEIFYISWEAIVNDRLSAFTEIPRKQGVAMRRKQNKLVYGVLNDNPTMADGGALFNTTAVSSGGHANLTTGAGAPAVSTINTLAKMMAKQKGLDPNVSSVLGLMPKFILAGSALGFGIQELIGSTSYPLANGNSAVKNIWYNALTPVIDEELGAAGGGTDTQWFLAASSDQIDTVIHAFLKGYQTPNLASQPSFERLAVKYRIFQPFAVKALDWRGLQKHAGA